MRRHRGNADVVRQELAAEKGIVVSLRTVERAVTPLPAGIGGGSASDGAVRDGAGQQMQIDFGERRVEIGGMQGARLSVRCHARLLAPASRPGVSQRAAGELVRWAGKRLRQFGGVTEEVLFDNARALVLDHDPATRTVVFNGKLKAFAKHWGFRPRACAPYRARTKGKTENGVGYVKRNAIAGRSLPHLGSVRGAS